MDLFLSAGNIDITPDKPIALAGFAERHGAYSQIHDRLEINLAVLQQEGQYVLLYSIDTLFIPEEFTQIILEKFGTQYNLQEKDIWIAASHTHFAPGLDREKPGLGRVDENYYQLVTEKLINVTKNTLTSECKKVSVSYGTGKSSLNVNRRKKLLRPKGGLKLYWKTLMYPDYDGVKDDDIHFIHLKNESGHSEMVLWNYACHPVGFRHRSQVSADFPGLIRNELRGYLKNQHLPVLFFIGFAGNIKPDVTPVTHTRFKDRINYFFQLGPKYTRFPSTSHYLEWIGLLWKETKAVLKSSTNTPVTKLSTTQYKLPLNEVIGEDSIHNIDFRKLSLAENIQFIGVSAEVLAEYKDIIAKTLNNYPTLKIGCLAGTRIYLPTDKNIAEGGYEVHWFRHRFGITGDFKENLDEKFKEALLKL